jgi:ABC-2 type transport system permease protein
MNLANRYSTLIKREMIEHRKAVIYAPFIIAGIMFALILVSALWNGAFKVNGTGFTAKMLESAVATKGEATLALVHQGWMFGFFTIFHIASGIVILTYSLGCLFDERKDRSTLFWRSLPVRDWETVISKLIMATLIIPAIFLIALAILQALIVVTFVVTCWQNQVDANRFVWAPLPFLATQFWQFVSTFAGILWALPVIGWILLCSAYAKQRPILLVLLIPGVIAAGVMMMNLGKSAMWAFGGRDAARDMIVDYFSRFGHLFIPMVGGNWKDSFENVDETLLRIEPIISHVISMKGLTGALIGAALIGTAIWVRRYREDAAI